MKKHTVFGYPYEGVVCKKRTAAIPTAVPPLIIMLNLKPLIHFGEPYPCVVRNDVVTEVRAVEAVRSLDCVADVDFCHKRSAEYFLLESLGFFPRSGFLDYFGHYVVVFLEFLDRPYDVVVVFHYFHCSLVFEFYNNITAFGLFFLWIWRNFLGKKHAVFGYVYARGCAQKRTATFGCCGFRCLLLCEQRLVGVHYDVKALYDAFGKRFCVSVVVKGEVSAE